MGDGGGVFLLFLLCFVIFYGNDKLHLFFQKKYSLILRESGREREFQSYIGMHMIYFNGVKYFNFPGILVFLYYKI